MFLYVRQVMNTYYVHVATHVMICMYITYTYTNRFVCMFVTVCTLATHTVRICM